MNRGDRLPSLGPRSRQAISFGGMVLARARGGPAFEVDGVAGRARQELLRQLKTWARGQEEIVALYLFGSEAAGTALRTSDLDVAVLARSDLPKERLWRLEDRWLATWTKLAGPRVDLVLLNLAPLPFRFEVISRGRLLWASDGGAVAEFESITRRRYWDLRPILERAWAGFVEQLSEARSEAERREYQAALEQVGAVHRRVREASARYRGGARG